MRAVDKTGNPPSRSLLHWTAVGWRTLQKIGTSLHFLAAPWPPRPDFSISIPSTLSSNPGTIRLRFYLPRDFEISAGTGTTYPAVVNFHGGGFVLGNATDDARFARFVLEICDAVFISVDYRLAPEYPFPTPVDDGADAILYVIRHAAELRINPLKLATSGFSAGGNIAITALLRLASHPPSTPVPEYRFVALAAWYPVLDYTLTRAERRASAVRPDQTIPPTLTDLFDNSYLYPPELDLADPLLSPASASDDLLKKGIPKKVLLYTCEWDMLMDEGQKFAARLRELPLGKQVHYSMIPGVTHGWDKGPNPVRVVPGSEEAYRDCCGRMRDIFKDD